MKCDSCKYAKDPKVMIGDKAIMKELEDRINILRERLGV